MMSFSFKSGLFGCSTRHKSSNQHSTVALSRLNSDEPNLRHGATGNAEKPDPERLISLPHSQSE
jgi:hypothetical protein